MSDGKSNMKFTETDICNVVHNLRSVKIDIDDTRATLYLLKKLKLQSSGQLFYDIKSGNDNEIDCILWADS